MKIKYTKTFEKAYRKKDLKIRYKFKEKLILFMENPFLNILNNHSLNGKYIGYNSINITGNFRAIFKENSNGNYEFITFIDFGSHSELYK